MSTKTLEFHPSGKVFFKQSMASLKLQSVQLVTLWSNPSMDCHGFRMRHDAELRQCPESLYGHCRAAEFAIRNIVLHGH